MDCHKLQCETAEPLFMGCMEGMLTVSEQEALTVHLDECKYCREEFEVYKAVWATLEAKEAESDAPRDFESGVMKKVESLPCKDSFFECAGFMLIGIFAAVVGALGTIFYQDIAYHVSQIIAAPEQLPIVGATLAGTGEIAESTAAATGGVLLTLLEMVTQTRFVLLAIFVVLILLQFFIYRFKKVW